MGTAFNGDDLMTAPIVTRSYNSSAVAPLFGYRPHLPIASRTSRSNGKVIAGRLGRDRTTAMTSAATTEQIQLWSRLLEVLPQGVIVVSRNLKPVYWNQKAKQLCQGLAGQEFTDHSLPLAISEACYSVLRDSHLMASSLLMECQTSTGHTIRVSAQILEAPSPNAESSLFSVSQDANSEDGTQFIAVFIENCSEVLQHEAWIQQQKYDLTDRETEIWMLLRQEFTYQDIAKSLQISLNTVKTHVKNVYAKRRSSQGKDKFWC